MRFQFSLKALLLVTLAAGVVFSVWPQWTHDRSAAALREQGAFVSWVPHTNGDPFHPPPGDEFETHVTLGPNWNGSATDLRGLRGLKRLRRLNLQEQTTQGADLSRLLPQLVNLEELTLDYESFFAIDTAVLRNCAALKRLHIAGEYSEIIFQESGFPFAYGPGRGGGGIDSAFEFLDHAPKFRERMPHLGALSQFRVALFDIAYVDRATLASLSELRHVTALELRCTTIRGDDLRPLQKLTNLQALKLESWELERAGSIPLPPNLVDLELSDFAGDREITKAGPFAALTKLRTLRLSAGKIAADFVPELERLGPRSLQRIELFLDTQGVTRHFLRDASGRLQEHANLPDGASIEREGDRSPP